MPTENAANYPATLFLTNAFRPRGEYLLSPNGFDLISVSLVFPDLHGQPQKTAKKQIQPGAQNCWRNLHAD
jgi:hypothetical protein